MRDLRIQQNHGIHRKPLFREYILFAAVPIGSMYGIYTYIWLIFVVNVGKYTIHGSYGIVTSKGLSPAPFFFRDDQVFKEPTEANRDIAHHSETIRKRVTKKTGSLRVFFL